MSSTVRAIKEVNFVSLIYSKRLHIVLLLLLLATLGLISAYARSALRTPAPPTPDDIHDTLPEIIVPPLQVVPVKHYNFQDLTTVHGKHKEAYGFLLCTREENGPEEQLNFDALRISVHRLKRIMEKEGEIQRDIIAVVCKYTPHWQYIALKNLDITVIPVATINPALSMIFKRWQDNFTKFQFWRLTNWDRILVMDIDIFFNDDFTTVFDEPASQIKYYSSDLQSSYMGADVKDLYPYVHAAVIDTSVWAKWIPLDKFNAGFYVMKPNLNIFKILMQAAWNSSLHFEEMEQSVLNYVYSRINKSPIPWSQLNETYNFFPDLNPKRNISTKAYHCKVWKFNPPEIYHDLIVRWKVFYEEMKEEYPIITVLDDRVTISEATGNSIEIGNLTVSDASVEAVFHAVASTNLERYPSHQEILQEISNEGLYIPGSKSNLTIGPANLKIEGLSPSTRYNIYYFANTTTEFSRLTDIYYVQVDTTAV